MALLGSEGAKGWQQEERQAELSIMVTDVLTCVT